MDSLRSFRVWPSLTTERLILRRPLLTDTDALYACMRDPEVSRYETWHAHESVLDTLAFVNDLMTRLDEHRAAEWVIERRCDRQVIGLINLHDFDEPNGQAEIGFWLGTPYRHKGYATEAAKRVLRFALCEMHADRVAALCCVGNDASEKVLRRLGFTYEGTARSRILLKGVRTDVKVFSLLYGETDENTPQTCHNAAENTGYTER